MHYRQNGMIVFECDCCDETFETWTNDWDRALERLKAHGWRYRVIRGTWMHTCQQHVRELEPGGRQPV